MYELLQRELPHTTLVSVAHRLGVIRFHRQILAVQPGPNEEPARLVPRSADPGEPERAGDSGHWALAGA